jgi:hypothetical protein
MLYEGINSLQLSSCTLISSFSWFTHLWIFWSHYNTSTNSIRVHTTQHKVTELVQKTGCYGRWNCWSWDQCPQLPKKSLLLNRRSSTVLIITPLILKFITLPPIKNYLLTALRTSSRWPSTPPNIAIQTSVLMFHNLKAWSFDTDNSKLGSRGWNFSSFIAWPWPV